MRKFLTVVITAGLFTGGVSADAVSPEEVRDLAASGNGVVIIDIRSAEEYMSGHLTNALHMEWTGTAFAADVSKYVPSSSTPVVVVCADGTASVSAAALLERAGYTEVMYLEGGMAAGDGILSAGGTSEIRAWHVIKSMFSAQSLPRTNDM